MDKNLIGRKVKIWLKDSFKREGKLLEVDDNFICIKDIKDGLTFIAISEIRSVNEIR